MKIAYASSLILAAGSIIEKNVAYAQSADLAPIIINPEDVYKVNSEKPGNFYSSDYKNRVEMLEQENQNLHKVIREIRQDVDKKPENKVDGGEVVNLKSNLYDLQKENDELRSSLDEATQKIDVLQNLVNKQKLNEKYIAHRLRNIDDEIDERAKKKIKELQETVAALSQENAELKEEIQSTDVVASTQLVNDDISNNIFFKKEVVSIEEIESNEPGQIQPSSFELLKIDPKGIDIEYIRGEKEMFVGTSDFDHMGKISKVDTNYPPLEETLPREDFND
ncbi:MAG: Atg14 domain-containing protein [Alphaproteobacteria bacterium]|nr:Atg14 domain-containing protein [Alphaproteobacteria bacterium]